MPLQQTTSFLLDFDLIMAQPSSEASCHAREEEGIAKYSLATLRHLIPATHRIIDDARWQAGDPGGFEQRFSVTRYYLPPPMEQGPRSTSSSETSSMAMTAATTPSTRPPPLAGLSTAGPISRPHPSRVDAGESGVLEAPDMSTSQAWQCSFGFLGCEATFDDIEAWNAHCKAHFRGRLPRMVTCPFGCPGSFLGSTGIEAWQERIAHVHRHHEHGGRLRVRPDQNLICHLWRTRVVTDAEEQELRRCGRLGGNSVYLESASSGPRRRGLR
jgi:hypothetical protein